MKNHFLLSLLILTCFNLFSQNQLIKYNRNETLCNTCPIPIVDNPAKNIGTTVNNYKIGHNSDFSVQVSKTQSPYVWEQLFEYNTYVNSSSETFNIVNSSFVTFDFSGSVTLQITCNRFTPTISNVIIRPQSKSIPYTVSGNVITIVIIKPGQFSVEALGDRYHNLQIFANPIVDYLGAFPPASTSSPNYIHFEPSSLPQTYVTPTGLVGSKYVHIKAGATVIVPYTGTTYSQDNGCIIANTGDQFYIEDGGILKGGIVAAEQATDINIFGNGIIDLTDLPKTNNPNSDTDYAYIQGITMRKCNTIGIYGVTINDPQQLCVELTDSDNVDIWNAKLFSSVIWGDGFHMKGTSNVTIDGCYIRTADDCISIYASRHVSWENTSPDQNGNVTSSYMNRSALNYNITNCSLYADFAHAIEIGWHGNQNSQKVTYLTSPPYTIQYPPYIPSNDIYNLTFDHIDILEHNNKWTQHNANNTTTERTDYYGALSVNCGDGNNCSNISFQNINVEDFTHGRLFSVNVEPASIGAATTDGKSVANIRFVNLSYKSTGHEDKSTIKGIWCDKYVDGVFFENFKVNGFVIKSLDGINSYKINGQNGIDKNDYAYNITFDEANRYTTINPGHYAIKNVQSGKILSSYMTDYVYTTPSYGNSYGNYDIWDIELVPGTVHYRIKNHGDTKSLENTNEQFIGSNLSPNQWPYYCQGRFLKKKNAAATTTQEWKFESSGSGTVKIHNAYTRGFLSQDLQNSYAISLPENLTYTDHQRWILIPVAANRFSTGTIAHSDNMIDSKTILSPNPAVDYLDITYSNEVKNAKLKIIDSQGRVVYTTALNSNSSQIYIGDLSEGIYAVSLESDGIVFSVNKLVKSNK
jgi:hypothetical protein